MFICRFLDFRLLTSGFVEHTVCFLIACFCRPALPVYLFFYTVLTAVSEDVDGRTLARPCSSVSRNLMLPAIKMSSCCALRENSLSSFSLLKKPLSDLFIGPPYDNDKTVLTLMQ